MRESISTSAPCRIRASTAGVVIARLGQTLADYLLVPSHPTSQALRAFLATPGPSFPVNPALWSRDTPIKS